MRLIRAATQQFRVGGQPLLFALAVLAVAQLSALSPAAAGAPEVGVDRPGSDYRPPIALEPKQGSFLTYEAECEGLCAKDDRCMAWTMVKPGVQGPKAQCYLKNTIPAAKNNSCCTSGIAARVKVNAAPEPGEPEFGVDRPGNDYQAPFDLEPKTGSFLTYEMECKGLCTNDQRCKAWTMVKPGVQGPKAKCYLKNAVPAAKTNGCCSSGVLVREAPAPAAQFDPVEATDRDPTGKTAEQCAYSKQRQEVRCLARFGGYTAASQGCAAEAAQIFNACISLAAQAAQSQTAGTIDNSGGASAPAPAPGPSPAPAPAPAASNVVPAEWSDMLAAHNETRKRHCAPGLEWSAQLASAAQDWANKCTNTHSTQGGENLAFWVPTATNVNAYQNTWACEVAHYDFDNPKVVGGFKNGCDAPVNGHFTQVVWKDSRQLGCGKQTCNINGQTGVYTVCRYSPIGNYNADNITNLTAQVSRPKC